MKKWFLKYLYNSIQIWMFFILLGSIVLFPGDSVTAGNTENEKRVQTVNQAVSETVRVGWVSLGYYMTETDGERTGVVREYLEYIGNYANIKYVYIDGDFETLYSELKNGTIDVICGVLKYPERESEVIFLESKLTSEYLYAFTSSKNLLVGEPLESFNSLTFGCQSEGVKENFTQYAQSRGYRFEGKIYAGSQDVEEAVQKGEVDFGVLGGLVSDSSQYVISKIHTADSYAIVNPRKPELAKKMNRAIEQIELSNPDFMTDILSKYKSTNKIFQLSTEEKNYIKASGKKKVLVTGGLSIYQRYNTKENEFDGINIAILNYISDITGLKFEYMGGENERAYEQGADLIASLDNNYLAAKKYGYIITKPYYADSLVQLSRRDQNRNISFIGFDRRLSNPDFFPEDETTVRVWYNQMDQLFRDLDRGRLSKVITPSLTANYQIKKYGYSNIVKVPVNGYQFQPCIGVRNDHSAVLLSILNKAISSISKEEIQQIVQKYSENVDKTLWGSFVENPVFIILILVLVIILVILITIQLMHREKRKRDILSLHAKTDFLTGIYNRRATEKKIEEMLRKNESGKRYTLFIFDLDNFKTINDTYGHAVGDLYLKDFTKKLMKCFRLETDVLGRIGGDEFIAFLPLESDCIDNKVQRLFQKFDDFAIRGASTIKCTFSIGIAIAPDHGTSFQDLYHCADIALYKRKNSGKKGYCIYSADLSSMQENTDQTKSADSKKSMI